MAQKHDNYKNPCVVKIEKTYLDNYDYYYYKLIYDDENWCLCGTLEGVVAELQERM